MAAFLGLPIAVLIFVATALAVHLPTTFPFRETIVGFSRNAAVITVISAYGGATLQMAISYFHTEHPPYIFGPSLVVMTTTSLLPVACLFAGLWWAGIPIGGNASDVVARLRWLFAALPSIQVAIWGSAAALGRLF